MNTADRLREFGFDWGHGSDNINPEYAKEIKEKNLCVQTTNCVRFWIKWNNIWYIYRRGAVHFFDAFAICETKEEIEIVFEILKENGTIQTDIC